MFFSRDIHLHGCRLRKAERFYLLVFRVWLCQANKKPERGKRSYGECTSVIMMMGHETDAQDLKAIKGMHSVCPSVFCLPLGFEGQDCIFYILY